MNITIYIDDDGKVIITDLPADLAPLVFELRGESSNYHCNAITGFSLNEVLNNK